MNYIVDILFLAEIEVLIYLKRQLSLNTYLRFCRCVFSKSAGNAQWLQLSAITPHHREVVSRGGHQAFVRPSDGCADAEESLAGPYPADARRPPSAPCSVGAGPTSWTTVPTWQPADGHTPTPKRSNPASR